MSIYINIKEGKLNTPWIFYLKKIIYICMCGQQHQLQIDCFFSYSYSIHSFSSYFFLLKKNEERERVRSRLSTNDVRGRPSSWSFAFCPSNRRKKRKCCCCYYCCDTQKILFYTIIPLSGMLFVFEIGDTVESSVLIDRRS